MYFWLKLISMLSNNRGEVVADPAVEPGADPGVDPAPAPGGEDSWRDAIPEALRSDPIYSKYNSFEELHKGIQNLNDVAGRKGIILPKDGDPEDRERFLNELGRPKDPKEYKFDIPENLHESIKVTDEAKGWWSSVAHKAGLTGEQANEVNAAYLQKMDEQQRAADKALQAEIEATSAELRKEWGADYDKNFKVVQDGLMKVGGQYLMDSIGGEKGLGNSAPMLSALAKLFGQLSEDSISAIAFQGGRGPQGSEGNETKEEALAKLKTFQDTEHENYKSLYTEQGTQKHKDAVKERQRLYQIAYATE